MWPFLIGYAVFVSALVVTIQMVRPRWSRRRLMLTSAVAGPALVLFAAVAGITFILVGPHPPDEVDSTSMSVVAVIYVSALAIPMTLLSGIIVSWFITSIWPSPPSE